MNLSFKNYKEDKYLPKFQEGGNIPPEQVPAETESEQVPAQDPMEQLIQAAMQALQTQDCQTAMAVCQALVQAAAPAQEVPQEAPVYKVGGKLSRRIKRD